VPWTMENCKGTILKDFLRAPITCIQTGWQFLQVRTPLLEHLLTVKFKSWTSVVVRWVPRAVDVSSAAAPTRITRWKTTTLNKTSCLLTCILLSVLN